MSLREHRPDAPDRFATAGFSLVETLAALFLVSTCMLGAAGFINYGLALVGSANRHSAAAVLLGDLAGRLRAHAAGAAAFTDPAGTCQSAEPGICAAQSAARATFASWLADARERLPGVTATVEPAATGGYSIVLNWTDPREGELGASLPVALPPR